MDEYLFPGERVLDEQAANLLLGLDPTENFGTPHGPATALLVTARSLAKAIEGEAIGGRLYLTSHRLFFVSHGANWTRGSYGVFLPMIGEPLLTDGLLSDQLSVASRTHVHRFVVRNAPLLAEILAEAKKTMPDRAELGRLVLADLDKVGAGVAAKWPGTHPSAEILSLIEQSVEAKETDALQALAILSALELFVD